MAGARFDILFAGELMGDADLQQVRSQLQQRFKLSEAATARLFSGRTVTVKRGVDTATASRYRKVFRDAKALIEIRPVDLPSSVGTSEPPSEPTPESLLELTHRRSPGRKPSFPISDRTPQGYDSTANAHTDGPQVIDLSHLSLVQGNDWTLEDCQPPLPPVRLPDTSHLAIVPSEPATDPKKDD